MRIALIAAAVSAASVILGHQALTAEAFNSGVTPTPSACEEDGVSLGYETGYSQDLGSYAITSVDVRDLNKECKGSTLEVTLTGEQGNVLSVIAVEIDGETVSFDIGDVKAKDLAGVAILVADR